MKIAIVGYGVMGRLIETAAIQRGHEISAVLDEEAAGLSVGDIAAKLEGAEAAIDFSTAAAVRNTVDACMTAGVPLVEGTTGWMEELDAVRKTVEERGGGFVYGANFSIGVNVFYRIVREAASAFAKFGEYEVFIEERHHSRKIDAPSGTALKLESIVRESIGGEFSVSSTRAGNIPGTHIVGFDGPADQVTLEHTARSREGFAQGAVSAAEWVKGRKGFWEFTDVIDEILS